MKSQRPIAADDEHRVLQFRPRTPVPPPAWRGNAVELPQREDKLSESLDLSRYERPRDEPDNFRQRMLANIAAFAFTVALTAVAAASPAENARACVPPSRAARHFSSMMRFGFSSRE